MAQMKMVLLAGAVLFMSSMACGGSEVRAPGVAPAPPTPTFLPRKLNQPTRAPSPTLWKPTPVTPSPVARLSPTKAAASSGVARTGPTLVVAAPSAAPQTAPAATPGPKSAPSEAVSTAPPSAGTTAATAGMLAIKVSSANVRGGPGVAYAILGAASGDQKLRLTGRLASGEWWQVEYQGRPGWVAASVATAPGDTSTIPVISVIPPTPSGAQAPAASGPAAAGGGHIAFASGRGDGSDLALLDVSTGIVSTVAENGRQPDMFSDGRIVFKGAGNGRDNIFTVRSDGGSLKQITAFGEDQWPLWSSSGKELSYFSTSGQQPERVCVQRDLSGPVGDPLFRVETITRRNGTPNPVYGRYPAWVAYNRIGFTGCDTWVNGNNCGLWSLDVDNWTEFRPYPLAGDQEARASDSFGDTLLYSSPAAGNWEILAVRTSLPARRDTPKPVPVNLTNNSAQDVGASFSPDGKQIAFISNRGGSWGIWVMNPDGGNARLLASVPPGFGPHWDAERVAWGP